MQKKIINQTEDNEQVISDQTFNDDRTLAFKINRQPHKNDSIAWIVGSFFMFIILVMSVGRITIIGQLIDDAIFSFVFGWTKYLAYLTLFGVNLGIVLGTKVKFKWRFLAMICLTWISLAWIISSSVLIAQSSNNLWTNNMFVPTFNNYVNNWQDNSIFGTAFANAANQKFFFWNYPAAFVNLGQSGGIVGIAISAIVGYLTFPASLAIATFVLFIDLMWVLTGNPIYLFLPKKKRKGRRLRLLAMKNNNNPYKKVSTSRDVETVDTKQFKVEHQREVQIENNQTINSQEDLFKEITMIANDQDMELSKPRPIIEDSTFEFKNYEQELDEIYREDDTVRKAHLKSREEFLEAQKAEFENLNPDEIRDKFAREFSDIRPYGNIDQVQENVEPTVKEFVPFKEASLDDTDFLNDLAAETHLPQTNDQTSTSDLIIVEDDSQTVIEEFEPYNLPKLSLLDDVKQDRRYLFENQDFAKQKQLAIDATFNQFKVGAKVVNIIYGPAVIKFEVQPEPGTKVNSISALENDLKLALASQNMRIEAPIPGKNLVGIEIENKNRLVVGLKEILEELEKTNSKNKLLFGLGKDVENKPIIADLAKMPHLLVAGATGSGKSVMINAMIISLLMRAKPNEVKFLLIDPKKVELGIYSNLPHMLMPVISDMKQANQALKIVIAEMDRRYDLFASVGARNLESYNKKEKHQLPYYVVVIDELADLMMTVNRKEVEDSIMRITQMARAAGIHLIVATQRPSVDVITGVIKANIPTRMAFAVATGTDSRTIIDANGAEKLTGKGDMLYVPPGTSDLVRGQGAYLSDEEIERVINFIKEQQTATYQQSFLNQIHEHNVSNNDHEDEQMYAEIKNFVIEQQKVSINLLQRKFAIGYNKAANFIDQLEADGIVGPQNGAKGRTVLIN